MNNEIRNISPVDECQLIDLPKIEDPRGNLTYIEGMNHIPFEIKRTYLIYEVPGGATRGAHANKNLEEFFIALSGSFDMIIDDGRTKHKYHMNRSYFGLFVPRMQWRHLENFSTNTVCMILASDHYCQDDYIRDYQEYLSRRKLK